MVTREHFFQICVEASTGGCTSGNDQTVQEDDGRWQARGYFEQDVRQSWLGQLRAASEAPRWMGAGKRGVAFRENFEGSPMSDRLRR